MSNFKNVDDANASFDHLKRLYESSRETIDDFSKLISELREENDMLKAKLYNCGTSNDNIKQIMQNALTRYNLVTQNYISEIDELRVEIKELKQ